MARRELRTFRQFAEEHPAFTEGMLRWYRFNQDEFGLGSAFLKIGGRVFVDVDAFFEAIDRRNATGPTEAA